ncbi:hypothetical protein Tco_0653199 [Tanacetum coccineum]|uniref:Uncharacterized protein n=1 Tax=Tanacetum coccineum TaxID=301880 RepID=A0ABQ4X065_9ASTR
MNQEYFYSHSSGFDQFQPEYLQTLLQSLLEDLQILNEIQPLKQETPNQIHKDQEEKSIVELLAEERFQKDNQALNENQSSQEMKIQDLEFQKQQCLEEMKEWMNELGIREYRKEEIDIDFRRNTKMKRDIIARYSTSITPDLPIEESENSLIMGDEPLSTIPATESDEVIKSSVENLVPIPSEFEGISDDSCDVPIGRINVESDFVESLINRDTSIVYSSKIDPILEEFTDELAHIAPIPPGIVAADPEIVEVCVDDDDTDDDDDYDDDFYDCVDIEEDGGEIDLDISKIVDISLREKLVESYLLIEKINAFSLSPPIPISPIICPSSTIPVVDIDLPLEEADLLSFSDNSITRGIESDRDSGEDTTSIDDLPLDDSMILSEYESFTFDDEPVMAEVNVFDEINTSELSYPGIGENVVLDEEEDTFTFTTRIFLPFVTYPEVLPASYSTGSEDKIFNPGIFDNDAFKDKSSKELAPSKALLTLDVFDPPHPPLMTFNVTKAFFGFTFSILKIFSKKFFEPGIKNATLHGSILWKDKAMPTISIDGFQSSLHKVGNLILVFIELTSILLA